MQWLRDRLARLRWMAIPIAAYLVITLALPLANGAAARGEFARHAAWVLAGCAIVIAAALLGGIALELARRGLRRLGRAPSRLAVVLGVAAALSARAARADQCQWLERDVATRAARELARHPEVVSFCEPCGDAAPGAPRTARRVTLQADGNAASIVNGNAVSIASGNAVSIAIDGEPIDLAYTYVQTTAQQYRNLAQLAGCPAAGVSPRLRVDAATRTGVLIHADPAPAAPAPLAPLVARTVYIEAPSSARPAVILLGCGALLGLLVAGALRLGRRRGMHQPRASDLEPRS
jgi:hypothetical protein